MASNRRAQLVEPIDFNRLRRELKELMEAVDERLESEFDSFSPAMWAKLERTVNVVIMEIRAVRLALNGYTSAEVAAKLGLKRQFVAALLAWNTMLHSDYASPETIIDAVDCPYCQVGVGQRCVSSGNQDARVHDSRREYYRVAMKERALTTKKIRKIAESHAD
jgi:hypothetical protein